MLPPKQRRTHLTIRRFMSPINRSKIPSPFSIAHGARIRNGVRKLAPEDGITSVLSPQQSITGHRALGHGFFFAYGPMVISEVSSAGALFRSYGELESISGRMTLQGCPAVQLWFQSWTSGPRRVKQNMAPKAGVQGCKRNVCSIAQ